MVQFKSLKAPIQRNNLLKGDLSRWNIKIEQILKSLKLEFCIMLYLYYICVCCIVLYFELILPRFPTISEMFPLKMTSNGII